MDGGISIPSWGSGPSGATCSHLGPQCSLTLQEPPGPSPKLLGEEPLGKAGLGSGLKSLLLGPAWPRAGAGW